MYAPLLALALCGVCELASAFSISPQPLRTPARSSSHSTSMSAVKKSPGMSRRSAVALGFLGAVSALSPQKASADELTPAQQEEYKKLLKQAFRIQEVIDANVEATKAGLGDGEEENGAQEYLRLKKEGKLPAQEEEDDKPQNLVPLPSK